MPSSSHPRRNNGLKHAPGGNVALLSGTSIVQFRVAGGMVRTRPGQRIAVMDIAAAQWRFGLQGKISRVDLATANAASTGKASNASLQTRLGSQLVVAETRDDENRTDRLSRAYRINMNVLALVALFTGAFLVFSTQALAVVRRRAQFAMLRVLGFTRGQLLTPDPDGRRASRRIRIACSVSRSAMRCRASRCVSSAVIWAAATFRACSRMSVSSPLRAPSFLRWVSACRCLAVSSRRWKRLAHGRRRRSKPAAKKARWRGWRRRGPRSAASLPRAS